MKLRKYLSCLWQKSNYNLSGLLGIYFWCSA